MSELVQGCPLCGTSASSLFDERTFRGYAVSNRICQECGLVYQSPRMTEAESKLFYEAEYRQIYQGQAGPGAQDLAVQKARAEIILNFARRDIKQISRHLDIGCSSGALLERFRAFYQSQAYGIEPGDLYREYARAASLQVYASLDELLLANVGKFDLISMLHVLEHLPDPVVYLQTLREQLLNTTGWLLLEVPNLYAHDCFEVAHLVSFSRHTLFTVVEKAGYQIVHSQLHGLPRSQLIPLYITLIAKPSEKTQFSIKPELLVRQKRQLGFIRRRLVTRLAPQRAWLPQ
jgi:SAM-dependent methyltransferase